MNYSCLVRHIREAFAEATVPAMENILHKDSADVEQVKDFLPFANKSWEKIPTHLIEDNYFVLPFLSPEAFRAIIPAFMLISIQDTASTVFLFTYFGVLGPDAYAENGGDHRSRHHFVSQLSALNAQQRDAVNGFAQFSRQFMNNANQVS